eukprot:Em0018g1040a
MTEPKLCELASCLVDGTVFEIVKELEEIQQLNERAFLNRHEGARHRAEVDALEKTLAEDMRGTDQKIIMELDQLVFEQQTTSTGCRSLLLCD